MTDQSTPYQDLDQGLNDLLADAHERVAIFVDDKLTKVQETRGRLARYRGVMQALFEDVKYTRVCEATLGQQLLGSLPSPPLELTDQSEVGAAIAPPLHQASPDEITRLANDIARSRFPISQRIAG